jgi:nitroreductase
MVISHIRKRRSIRHFLKKPVEPEKIDILLEAALRAPSSRGTNPWELVVVTNHDGTKSAEEYVVGVLNIPAQMKVACIIAIGYPDMQKPPHKAEELLYEKVHRGIYGKPYYTVIV